ETKRVAYQSGVTGPGIGNSFMHPILPRNDVYRFIDNSNSQDTINRQNPNETETVETTLELAPGNPALIATVTLQIAQLKKIGEAQLAILDQQMKQLATSLGMAPVSLKPDDLEKKAMAVIPMATPKVKEAGYGGYRQFMPQIPREQMTTTYREIGNTSELERLCNGKHNAVQIKQMLDTQYPKESSLTAIMAYIEVLKTAGLVVQK
ncbi:MAG: hypothetical protein HGB35_08855, partial [Geobacteraceae bacterium]|nr:hypothetical protein [Geobacteraceae bacterium]